jgi:nicotinate-nucleotide adenylyltransferase
MTIKVGIFGGAFDPPHLGHNKCIEFAMGSPARCDRIFVIPSGERPDKPHQSPFDMRMKMAQIAFQSYSKVLVGGWEDPKVRQGPTFTYDTLMILKGLYPYWEFHLLVGADNKDKLSTWYKGDLLLKELAGLIVVPRDKRSSTSLREMYKKSKFVGGTNRQNIDPLIDVFIRNQKMYQ